MSEDVNSAQPSNADQTQETGGSSPADVNAARVDRPVENAVAEFNRKFQRLQDQNNSIIEMIQQQRSGQPQPGVKGPATDEELWALAQQGDRQAFELYQERIAERKFQQMSGRQNQDNLVDNQLNVLGSRYPVLNDPSHPLAQATSAAYQAMLQRGYAPGKATLLDAAKTAIADRPDLAADVIRPANSRPSAAQRAASGQMGASHRAAESNPRNAPTKVSPEQAALAKRMGVKDPAKSIERFKQRQESGASSLGAVASHVTEEL